MWFLALAGQLIWPVFRVVAPWAGPKFSLFAVGALLALVGVGAPALGVYIHMRGELKEAVADEGARWHKTIQKANETHAEEMQAALAAAEREEADDPTPAHRGKQLVSLCDRSRACRDRKK